MAGAEECHFIGHLTKEQDACVAMTGCVGSEDIDFTIMSSHATKSAMFKWSKDGHVEIIESPFKVKNHMQFINTTSRMKNQNRVSFLILEWKCQE